MSFSEHIENINHIFSAGLNNVGDLHPLIVHFPIALLIIAPIFILIGLFLHQHSKSMYLCASILMIIGTFSILIAIHSGEKASEPLGAEIGRDAIMTLDKHDKLGHQSRNIFIGLTALFLAFLYLQNKNWLTPKLQKILLAIYLLLYILALIILASTAHHGGKLVHQYGIHSQIYKEQ